MLRSINRNTLIGAWIAALITVAAAGAFSGVSITVENTALWLVLCVAPPAVLLMLWRNAPPPTVAEVLNATERRD